MRLPTALNTEERQQLATWTSQLESIDRQLQVLVAVREPSPEQEKRREVLRQECEQLAINYAQLRAELA